MAADSCPNPCTTDGQYYQYTGRTPDLWQLLELIAHRYRPLKTEIGKGERSRPPRSGAFRPAFR